MSTAAPIHGGWIPPEQRTREQRMMTDAFHEQIGEFQTFGTALDTIPERVLACELERKATGDLLPRIWQVTGSCVGCGGARAYTTAIVGDVIFRSDHEAIKIPFPFSTYGIGRQLGGMRGPGEGSFGPSQAEACKQFGLLPYDHRLVQPATIARGWAKWSRSIELEWSHPSSWRIPYDDVESASETAQVGTVTRIGDVDELPDVIAQGFGITLASMFGTRPRVRGDVLLGDWNASWAHQMSCSSYWDHADHGMIYAVDNQWGPDAHPECPTLAPLGVRGTFWITRDTFARIIRSGEVYAHSNTEGFPKRDLWRNMGL